MRLVVAVVLVQDPAADPVLPANPEVLHETVVLVVARNEEVPRAVLNAVPSTVTISSQV